MAEKSEFDFNSIKNLLDEYGDDSYECELVNKKVYQNPVDEKSEQLIKHHLENGMSYKNVENIAKMMNRMPGAELSIPDKKGKLKSVIIKDRVTYEYHVFCKCDNLVKDGSKCEKCGTLAKKNSKTNNFLVSISLIPQVKSVLETNYDQIMQYIEREHDDMTLTDVDDGKAFKKIASEHPNINILPLTLNIDGAVVYRSKNSSLWLTQVYLDFLPPKIRFHPENILLVSLYYGTKKPNEFHLVSFLARELEQSHFTIFDGVRFQNFMPAVVNASCDLPAKSM